MRSSQMWQISQDSLDDRPENKKRPSKTCKESTKLDVIQHMKAIMLQSTLSMVQKDSII